MRPSRIDTTAGEVVVSTLGAPRPVTVGDDDALSYYDVPVRVSLGQRTVCGDVSIGLDGHAIGQSRDAWVSGGVLALIEQEVPEAEQIAVLSELAAAAGAVVAEVQS